MLVHTETIVLEGDLFTGTFPTTIGLLTNLIQFQMRETSVSGTIPTEIGNCGQLLSLIMIDTFLDGTIPTEIGNLDKLRK